MFMPNKFSQLFGIKWRIVFKSLIKLNIMATLRYSCWLYNAPILK